MESNNLSEEDRVSLAFNLHSFPLRDDYFEGFTKYILNCSTKAITEFLFSIIVEIHGIRYNDYVLRNCNYARIKYFSMTPPTDSFKEIESAVVRFAGDSGDGMQTVGERFTDSSVRQ